MQTNVSFLFAEFIIKKGIKIKNSTHIFCLADSVSYGHKVAKEP